MLSTNADEVADELLDEFSDFEDEFEEERDRALREAQPPGTIRAWGRRRLSSPLATSLVRSKKKGVSRLSRARRYIAPHK